MTDPFPHEVAPGNDLAMLVGPIKGLNLTSGAIEVYGGATIRGFWSVAAAGATPLGSVDRTFNQIGSTGKFVVSFEAADMDTVLTGLAQDSIVHLVLIGATNFRGVIPFIVRTARELV